MNPFLKPKLSITVLDQFVAAKTSKNEDCEDFIYIDPNFVAVIDGVTSTNGFRWLDGRTGGQVAAGLIEQVLENLPPESTALEASEAMTKALNDFYHQPELKIQDFLPYQRILGAKAVVLSLSRGEIWLFGDCQFLIDNQLFVGNSDVEDRLAEIRALRLEQALAQGLTISELLSNDLGRDFILPLLHQRNSYFNNYVTHTCSLDGFPFDPDTIVIKEIPFGCETVVLASDGYPILKNDLLASEAELAHLIKTDPLFFRQCKKTKGVLTGYNSFDDRAFIKLRLDYKE